MSYAKTGNINIFPLSKSRPVSPDVYDSRRIYEYSIANIIRQMTDKSGFVISTAVIPNKPFKFNLHGYYIELTDPDILSTTPLYAVLNFTDQGWTSQIAGQDTGDNYQGIEFKSSLETGDEIYLQLLDGSGKIPEESKYRLKSDIVQIDGLRSLGGTSS